MSEREPGNEYNIIIPTDKIEGTVEEKTEEVMRRVEQVAGLQTVIDEEFDPNAEWSINN